MADTYDLDDLSFTDPSTPPPPPPTAGFTCATGCDADAGATIGFLGHERQADLQPGSRRGRDDRRLHAADPSHAYTKPGLYTITLQVIDSTDGESTTVEHTVTIFARRSGSAGAASDISTEGKLNGTVDPRGGPVTDRHFDWGPTTKHGHTAVPCSTSPGDGSGPVAVSAAISLLASGTTYHYRPGCLARIR